MTSIEAHSASISDVVFDETDQFMITSSFDKTVRVWSQRTQKCVKNLVGHESRVMGVAVAPGLVNGQYLIGTVAFDRTYKLWATQGRREDWI